MKNLVFVINDRAYKITLMEPYFGFRDSDSICKRIRKWFHYQEKDLDGYPIGRYFNIFRPGGTRILPGTIFLSRIL